MRILYLQATVVPPPSNPAADRFALLSKQLEGDVLQPVWFKHPAQVESVFGPGSYPVYRRERFCYHWILFPSTSGPLAKIGMFWKILRKGLQLHRQSPFDCIVAYSHMTTGLIGFVLKLLTQARLVIEIATMPHLNHLSRQPKPSFADLIAKLYSDICLHITVLSSDRLHLLYPGQLETYRLLRKTPATVFHEFVPISSVPRLHKDGTDNFVVFVGAPWYLKGVDVLIRAFQRLAPDFPDVKLKLLGHFPDRKPLEEMIGPSSQIEIIKALSNEQTLRLISQATALVLPSRCEGMGRVLLEAMAAATPVIGSNIGGIPFLVRDQQDGFVVPPGDIGQLETALRKLLDNTELRNRFGASGYRRAHHDLNEDVYVNQFTAMVRATMHRVPRATAAL